MVRAFSVGNSVLKMETVRSPRGALHSSSMMAYSGASSLEAKKLCRPLLTSEPDTLYTVADLTIFSLPKNDAKKKKGRKEDTDTPSREAGNAVNRLEEQSVLAKKGVPPQKKAAQVLARRLRQTIPHQLGYPGKGTTGEKSWYHWFASEEVERKQTRPIARDRGLVILCQQS